MSKPDSLPPNEVTDEATPDMPQPEEQAPVEEAPATEPSPLEAAQARVAQLEDKLLRVEAEFLNETKRIRKNADTQGRFAIERVVTDLLPVIDALHSAHGNLSDDDEAHREGLELIERSLTDALGRHGIERIEAAGQPFDPGFHEAMMVIEDDALPAQTVKQEMRAGFMLNGRVVRPAQVIVSKRSEAAPPAEPAGEED